MPIITEAVSTDTNSSGEIDDSILFDPNGRLTLDAQTVASFLRDVDYSDFFEDEDMQAFVVEAEEIVKLEGDTWVPCEESDPDAVIIVTETLAGEHVAGTVDEDDLMHLFEYFLNNEHPRETMEDRLALGSFDDLLTESPFRKGQLRSKSFKGKSGGNERARMMYAMLKKGDIKRVKKGHGYKGGDYKYGKGGEANPAKYHKLAKNTVRAKRVPSVIKKHGPIEPDRKGKIVPMIYKNVGKKMPKPWVPPEKRLHLGAKAKPGGYAAIKKAKMSSVKKKAHVEKQKAMFKSKKSAKESAETQRAVINESDITTLGPALATRAMHAGPAKIVRRTVTAA